MKDLKISLIVGISSTAHVSQLFESLHHELGAEVVGEAVCPLPAQTKNSMEETRPPFLLEVLSSGVLFEYTLLQGRNNIPGGWV